MTDERRPLTDSQIEAGLARRAPRGAGSDLLVSIVTVAERTGQVSTWWPPQRPSAMTPRARLAWVAILVALSLAIGGLIVAAGSARHGPELGLTLEPTLTPSLAAVVPPSIAPTKSPRPSPTASPTEVSNIPPSTTQASSCEPDPIPRRSGVRSTSQDGVLHHARISSHAPRCLCDARSRTAAGLSEPRWRPVGSRRRHGEPPRRHDRGPRHGLPGRRG